MNSVKIKSDTKQQIKDRLLQKCTSENQKVTEILLGMLEAGEISENNLNLLLFGIKDPATEIKEHIKKYCKVNRVTKKTVNETLQVYDAIRIPELYS